MTAALLTAAPLLAVLTATPVALAVTEARRARRELAAAWADRYQP